MQNQQPLVELINVQKRFGGIHAVENMSLVVNSGEVLGLLGHNGAGKSTLIKLLSGAYPLDGGEIRINGVTANIGTPRDAKKHGIETIYQSLALADNLAAPANIFFGRELTTTWGALDEAAMERASMEVMKRLNPQFSNFHEAVSNLSGGQRQSVAIARCLQFNAKILIMDEPTAALGPHETRMVSDLIKNLKKEGIGIIMISHDLHDVFDLSDRVCVMKSGRHVWTGKVAETSKDEVLQMIILGKLPNGEYAPGVLDR